METVTNAAHEAREKFDPFRIGDAFSTILEAWLRHPEALTEAYSQFFTKAIHINQQVLLRSCGFSQKDVEPTHSFDERFKDPVWSYNPISDCLKEYYLLTTHWLEDNIYQAPDVDEHTKRKAGFWARQYLNALAPTNFFWTNPEAIMECITTGGRSVANGMTHFFKDWEENTISMVDKSNFKVGYNLGSTKGKVVYQNDLLEVIQYCATTEKVHQIPIVLITPWINKYYILDLSPRKSLVRYLVESGFTVFITSWKNPTKEMRNVGFDDYMFEGILETINVAKAITKVEQVHVSAYCIAGSALAALMAWLNANKKAKAKNPVSSWTLLCALVDFESAGDVDVFIDENAVKHLESKMAEKGYLDGKSLENTFRTLRSNSLVWHYFVLNYLLGKTPPPFDILFWNTDSTRLPEKMHSWYLNNFYLENNLSKKNALTIRDEKIDLGNIKQPLYCVGTEQDHITPWQSTFKICSLSGGKTRYVLATSGHIVGVLSPPVAPPKRRYWVGEATGNKDAKGWLSKQEKTQGSWWEDWRAWLSESCGDKVSPPRDGNEQYKVLRDAPGKYVFEE